MCSFSIWQDYQLLLQEHCINRCLVVVSNILRLEHAIVGHFIFRSEPVELTSLNSVLEYTYLLFWNVFWTLCPVIAIGVFDRFIGVWMLLDSISLD